MFRLGYNTNGLAHHRLTEALELLAEIGYRAVALTPDVGHLDPYRSEAAERRAIAELCAELDLEVVIETGARFLLDPRRMHFPTVLETEPADRDRRIRFLQRSADLAAELGGGLVSIWSGAAPDGSTAEGEEPASGELWDHLCEGIERVLVHAAERGVRVAFEPEPGMFVERPAGYHELVRRLGAAGTGLGLTLDVGHLLCTGDLPVERVIAECADCLWNVHLDDISGGQHDHRMFGTGDLDPAAALKALIGAGYDGVASVELSRDSFRGPIAATEAMSHLRQALRFSP